jgi:phenylacetate-CoA ligase
VPIVYIRSRPRFGFTTYRQIWFFARSFTSIRYRLDDLRELALNLRGRFFLYAYTSWCVEIARILEQRGETLPVGAVMVAGEHLLPEDAALIRRAFGHDPYQLYASREVGFLAFECDARRLHLNEEWAYVEIVSKEGRRVEDGSEGRVVVTTFDNTVMPFIRYDTGDLGILSPDPCPCGRTLRTLHFTGRTSELITVAGGTSVALLDVAHALGGHIGAFQQYQIVQRGPVSFLIRHVPGPAFETHRDRIRALLVRMLHPEALIEFEAVDVISEAPSGKAVYFVREL